MNKSSDNIQAESQKPASGRNWIRLVLLVQCVAVLALVAIVIGVSGVLDGDNSGSAADTQSSAVLASETNEEAVNLDPTESSSSFTESSFTEPLIAESNDSETKSEETSNAETPASPNAESKPDNANKAESKPLPQAEKSSTKKPAGRQPENPLKQLPESVDILKTLTSHEEIALGPVSMPPDIRLDIEMHGGATAHRVKLREQGEAPDAGRQPEFAKAAKGKGDRIQYEGVPTFRFRETFDEAGNTFWTVDLTEYRGTIARIWLAEDQLRFQWTENSGHYEESGYLANCVLLITVPNLGRVHALALRKPIRTKAAPIDFVRGASTSEFIVPFMPPDVTLTVEAVGATKPLPKPSLGMDRWLTTNRDLTYLKFGDGAPLVVKVLASTKYADGHPRIITASYFSLPRIAENISGTLSQLASVRKRTERAVQQLNGRKAELSKIRPRGDKQRSALSKARREIERDLRGYQSQMRQIKWLENVTKNSQKPPGIVFRIIHSAGDYTLDLVHGGM